MSAPLMPSLLDEVGRRRFAFYPSILNAEPNEWMVTGASWSDVQVVNTRTGNRLSVPRQYIGAIPHADDPILIVGLTKALEYREGAVWPRVKRIIEMPLAANDSGNPFRMEYRRPSGPAPVVGIKLENNPDSRTGRILVGVGISAVVMSMLAVGVFSGWISTGHAGIRASWQASPGFTAQDDYASIVRRLGPPAGERWLSGSNHTEFRALAYPGQKITIILMSERGEDAHYLATMNADWHVLHSVPAQNHSNSQALLRSLPRY
jgi:hypothetical protein